MSILLISSLFSEWSQKEQFISHGLLILIVNTISFKRRTRSSGTMTRYTCIWEEWPERHINIDIMINNCYHFWDLSERWQKRALFENYYFNVLSIYIYSYIKENNITKTVRALYDITWNQCQIRKRNNILIDLSLLHFAYHNRYT